MNRAANVGKLAPMSRTPADNSPGNVIIAVGRFPPRHAPTRAKRLRTG